MIEIKTISKHINAALKEELQGDNLVGVKFATTTKHGAIEGKMQTHMVDYYNIDMIISIGYRVKSAQGIIFRRWANKILKDYMFKGICRNTFLNFYGILYKDGKQTIDNNTLTALTLLIAESNPKEKDVIIDLVMNFLNND